MFAPAISIRSVDGAQPPVLLRPVTLEELRPLCVVDAEAARYLTNEELTMHALPDVLYGFLNRPDTLGWGIEVGDETAAELVGVCSMRRLGELYPEIGRAITKEQFLGRGVGTLAGIGMIAFALDTLVSAGVRARTLEVNTRAQRSLGKLGFIGTSSVYAEAELHPFGLEDETSAMTDLILFGPDASYQAILHPNVGPAVVANSYATFKDRFNAVEVRVDGRIVRLDD